MLGHQKAHQFSFKVKYRLGHILKTTDRIYKLVGYNYIKSRGIQYIYLYKDGGEVKWLYLYELEVEMIKES